MEDASSELSREVASILACKYPASLATLADILTRSDEQTVRACIHHLSPCAIHRLAYEASASLPHFAYSLRMLQGLCHSTEFRDALLTDNPALLGALLTKAIDSEHDFDEYSELCVLLLSGPLPAATLLPVSAQSFFLHLFKKAVQTPDTDNLKPVYSCLNGACRGLLSILSPEDRGAFDQELCEILHNTKTGQNSMLFLWCIGVVILAERPQEIVPRSASFAAPLEGTHESQWKTHSGRKLFGSSTGMIKTINLTFLSVVWATKGGVGVSNIEAIEGIRIATRAMRLVDRQVRETWPPTSHPLGKSAISKLVTKIQREDIDAGVKLEAISFYATVVGEKKISAEVVAQYETALLEVQRLHTDTNCLKETLTNSLPLFAPHLREPKLRQLLAGVLAVEPSSARPYELCNILVIVEELTALIPRCTAFSSQLALALSSDDLQENIQSFLQATVDSDRDGTREDCDTHFDLLQRTLRAATISMFLTSALTSRLDESGLSQTLVIASIRKQQELIPAMKRCNHPTANTQPKVSLFQQECTPSSGLHRQNWRDHLSSDIERQSSYQRDSVIRSVSLICEDLENRCNNVEEPLRREQAKVSELTEEISQLRGNFESLTKDFEALTTKANDRLYYSQGLEAQNEELSNATTLLASEKEHISAELVGLKAEFVQANRRADETLQTAQDHFSTKELQFQSMIFAHEQDLRARSQEITALNTHIQELGDEIKKAHEENECLRGLHQTLKTKFDAMEHDLGDEIKKQHDENESLRELHQTLKSNFDVMEHDLRDELKERYDENESLRGLHQTLKVEFDAVEHDLEKERRKTAQQAGMIVQLEDSNCSLEKTLSGTRDELRTMTEKWDKLQAAYDDLVRSSRAALQDLELRYEDDIQAVASKAKDAYDQLQVELQEALSDAQKAKTAYDSTRRDLQLAQDAGDRLEEQVQELEDACVDKDEICAEKDNELRNLRSLFGNIQQTVAMGSLGVKPTRTDRSVNKHRGSLSNPRQNRPRRPANKPRDVSPPPATALNQGISNTAMENIADASFESSDWSSDNGSTSKRQKRSSDSSGKDGSAPKRPKLFKVPSKHTPYPQKQETASRSISNHLSPPQRPASTAPSPNRRHTTVGFEMEDTNGDDEETVGKRRGSLRFDEPASFDMDRFLASTPFTPGNVTHGTGRAPEESEDETTEL